MSSYWQLIFSLFFIPVSEESNSSKKRTKHLTYGLFDLADPIFLSAAQDSINAITLPIFISC